MKFLELLDEALEIAIEREVDRRIDKMRAEMDRLAEEFVTGPEDIPAPVASPMVNLANSLLAAPIAPVTLKRPVLQRPEAPASRPQAPAKRPKQPPKPKPVPPPEPAADEGAAIDMEPTAEEIAADAEALTALRSPSPAPEAVACDICGRALPPRLVAMHRANCERASKGLT